MKRNRTLPCVRMEAGGGLGQVKPNKFWRFANMEASAAGNPQLWIEGYIYPETPWWLEDGTICAPDSFRRQLEGLEGKDIDIHINSRGGDAAAGVAIYMLLRQRKGTNTFYIPALACSAATLPPMAPGKVYVGPSALMMVHNPMVYVEGDHVDLARAQDYLAKLKEAVIAAYEEGTGKSREDLSAIMDAETWYTAKGAVEAGFADGIMEAAAQPAGVELSFARSAVMQVAMDATMGVMNARIAQSEQDERAAILRFAQGL